MSMKDDFEIWLKLIGERLLNEFPDEDRKKLYCWLREAYTEGYSQGRADEVYSLLDWP